MLATRILHFAHKQVFWDCPLLSACETLPGGLPQPMDSVAGPDRHWRARLQEPESKSENLVGAAAIPLSTFWKTVVQAYTNCDLTFNKDKLIALWGIAKLFRDAEGGEYGNGLWEKSLEDQLAWRVAECKGPSTRNEDQSIPTWSWASMTGTIIVADQLTYENHYKVKDHHGQPLRFDLKGAKRFTRPKNPVRGQSDTDAELGRREEPLQDGQPSLVSRKTFPRSSSPELMNRDDQPVFQSRSIEIQGHVGRGRLTFNSMRSVWTLQVGGITEIEIEAFPDTMPDTEVEWARNRYFVVLAAKQVNTDPTLSSNSTIHGLAIVEEEQEEGDLDNKGFDYLGHGVLMRYVGNHHFRRTGAFRFRNASQKSFDRLQETEDWGSLPPEMYQSERGRKFWLD